MTELKFSKDLTNDDLGTINANLISGISFMETGIVQDNINPLIEKWREWVSYLGRKVAISYVKGNFDKFESMLKDKSNAKYLEWGVPYLKSIKNWINSGVLQPLVPTKEQSEENVKKTLNAITSPETDKAVESVYKTIDNIITEHQDIDGFGIPFGEEDNALFLDPVKIDTKKWANIPQQDLALTLTIFEDNYNYILTGVLDGKDAVQEAVNKASADKRPREVLIDNIMELFTQIAKIHNMSSEAGYDMKTIWALRGLYDSTLGSLNQFDDLFGNNEDNKENNKEEK